MKDTDATARDWIEGWRPPEMSERLAKVKNRVGKEMVHLSYNRLDVPEDEKGWTVLGIGPEVIGAFGKFATEVPDDLVQEGWRSRAYSATGTVPPERMAELEQYLIRADDLRPASIPGFAVMVRCPSPVDTARKAVKEEAVSTATAVSFTQCRRNAAENSQRYVVPTIGTAFATAWLEAAGLRQSARKS